MIRPMGTRAWRGNRFFQIFIENKARKNTPDQRHSNLKKNKVTEDIVAAVATAVKDGRRQTVQGLVQSLFKGRTQSKDSVWGPRPNKENVLWEPKLLNEGQKKDTVDKCNNLLKLYPGPSVLDRIGTMDELSVSLHMSETKQQSEQCAKKGQRGPA
jgi:hypothetical protein